MPYHQYSIAYIFKVLKSIGKEAFEGRIRKTFLEKLSREKSFENLENSHIKHFIRILEKAKDRYSMLTNEVYSSISSFIEASLKFTYRGRHGFLAMKHYFFEHQERFLFGIASQHRRSSLS